MVSEEEHENVKRQLEFYRSRLEAAEARLSLALRGFDVKEKKNVGQATPVL